MYEEMSYNKYNYNNDNFRIDELYNDKDNYNRLLINIDDEELTIKNLCDIINSYDE